MSVGAGVSVANLYFIQPVVALIGGEFHIPAQGSGALATASQAGYAAGMLLLTPLGDSVEKRRLILVMLCLVTCALAGVALAPGLGWLFVACFAVGLTTVTPQLLIPFAAHLADPAERGSVVGTVMSGLLVGVLLARTFSGVIASRFGWRAVYWVSAAMAIGLALVFSILLPRSEAIGGKLAYGELIRSMAALVRSESMLRRSAFYGGMSFAAFSAFWTVLPFFLAGAPYRYGPGAVGLFALVGVSGIVVAPLAGKLADRGHSGWTIGLGLSFVLAALALLAWQGRSLPALVAGLVILDLGVTANHISNQSRVHSLRPESRSRMNTVYMFLYFVGAAIGSLAGVFGWSHGGWLGSCAVAAAFPAAAIIVYGLLANGGATAKIFEFGSELFRGCLVF